MSHIFQKNATKFETRITRHETIRHDSVCDVMRFRKFTDTFDYNPLFLILAFFCTNGDSGTARYSTVLILTDGVRIYCGITSESKRIASSAPALFILVRSLFTRFGRAETY